MIKNVYWSSCKAPVIHIILQEIWIFSTYFGKKC